MIDNENLDVRTITMGISLLDCIDSDADKACGKIYDKICRYAGQLVKTGEDISKEYGIPIINKRISVTPIAMIAGACPGADPIRYAKALDRAAHTVGVNFIGGYSARVHKGFGPGVVRAALAKAGDCDITAVADIVKKTAFKITRMGQLVAQEASRRLCVPFGIVDLSLAPTPAVGDSVAHILEEMGLERCGAHGTTACLALLNDAVKKGGVMASSHVGGLSGAFIPVTEDAGMIRAAREGALSLTKLEAMTAVCSVGLDMINIPGDTSAEIISAIIADEAAIGMVNSKTTAVRVIPAIGKKAGEELSFGGLLGGGPIMEVNRYSPAKFIRRGGRIPAPLQSLKN